MKIAVDARCLNRENVRGIGKYLWNVLTHVSEEEGIEWQLYGDRPDLPHHQPPVNSLEMEFFDPPGFRFRSWEQFGLPYRSRRIDADLLHCTETTMPWWQPIPSIVTIHDTVPWDGNQEFAESWYWKKLLPAAYRKCAAIITISESSRRDIVRHWPELEEKLHVIYHGIEPHYLDVKPDSNSGVLSSMGVRTPYLLYFGGEIPRKRLDWAIKTWSKIEDETLQLVVCGVELGSHEKILEQVPEALRSRFVMTSFVPEESMPTLIQNAVAVLYPTLYEGFGLPALEAQAVGTPVVFSAVGSLVELEGPASHILPTHDLDAWVATCRTLVEQRKEIPHPIEKARKWACRFSWEESARKHLGLYKSVAQHRLKNSS